MAALWRALTDILLESMVYVHDCAYLVGYFHGEPLQACFVLRQHSSHDHNIAG